MAKNRTTIITELFQAFAKNDDFDYTEDQLWELFKDCVDKKLIKKLSKTREAKEDGVNSAPKSRGKSGYQHFLSEFSDPIPEGMKKREFKGAVWAKLTQEEKEEWNQKAAEVNEAAGIHKKPAPIKTSQEDIDKYEQLLMEWSSKDPETRGPMPSRPSSQKSSPASSEKSSPASSPPKSPKENSTENSNADDDSSDDEDLAEKLAKLQMKNDSDSDSDSDSDNEDEDSNEDDADNQRVEWLKLLWSEQGLKKNSVKNFQAWIYFTNTDIYGPNKDNNMSNTQLNEFKRTHDYETRKKDENAPWFDFITKNAIM
ncbi:MAG: hypothetical protein CBB97_02565 [Candidatus Endolissoclinum sp. TMED37]|nr:MAG: hypothetical protein CBB97_02565 [Candidatus Endolissoclinum sp. TMED37]|tara:strand:+ start:61 stop:999 length:939 start_codon:yes stop_codon:yes gene_type:complete